MKCRPTVVDAINDRATHLKRTRVATSKSGDSQFLDTFLGRQRSDKLSNHISTLLVWIGLFCLPGCSGCQQSPEKSAASQTVSEPPTTDNETTTEITDAAEPDEPISEADNATSHEKQESLPKSESVQLPEKSNSSSSSRKHKPRSSTGKQANPDAALAAANALREKAQRAADREDYGTAFSLNSQAWETARSFPLDSRLKQLTEELAGELEILGEQANSKVSGRVDDPSTTLIEK